MIRPLLALLFLLIGSALHAKEIKPGEAVTLAADEGLVLFDINLDIALSSIELDRIDSIFSFPRMKDLQPGRSTRLLKLPEGDYQFADFNWGSGLYWRFDKIKNSRFKVSAGKLNYVGEVVSKGNWIYRNLSIENRGLAAQEAIELLFPGITRKYTWSYVGEYEDPFFSHAAKITKKPAEKPEFAITPRVEDRDAAEIIFRSASVYADDLSPSGRFFLEYVSEGKNIAIRLVEIASGAQRVIYTGVPVTDAEWASESILAITIGTMSRLLRVESIDDVTPLVLGGGTIVGVEPSSGHLIVQFIDSTRISLRRVDPLGDLSLRAMKKLDRLEPSISRVMHWGIDAQGVPRIATLASKTETAKYAYVDPLDGKPHYFSWEPKSNVSFRLVGFDETGRLLALTDQDREFIELVEFDFAREAPGKTVLAIDGANIEGVIHGVNSLVSGVRYLSRGNLVGRALNLEGAQRKQENAVLQVITKAFPGQNVLVEPAVKNGSRLVRVDGPTEPGKVYLYNSSSKRVDLLSSVSPHMEGRAVASTERIVMKASDGVEIEAFLTRMPQSETNAKLPLLVLPHGGPFDVVDFQRFDPEVQFFAKLGFGVLQVNFRGSGGGKSKVELGYGKWGTTLISDIEVAVDAALQRFPLDADKVVAVGSSYGGYAALALARTNPERYKAVVGICGVYDLPLLFSAGLYSRREQGLENQKKILADPKTDMALLIDQSPAYDVEAIKAPVLLVHDRGDQIAPFEHAIRMSFVLNASGKRVDLLTTNDEVHGLVNEATAIAQYPKIAQFLRAALGSDRER